MMDVREGMLVHQGNTSGYELSDGRPLKVTLVPSFNEWHPIQVYDKSTGFYHTTYAELVDEFDPIEPLSDEEYHAWLDAVTVYNQMWTDEGIDSMDSECDVERATLIASYILDGAW